MELLVVSCIKESPNTREPLAHCEDWPVYLGAGDLGVVRDLWFLSELVVEYFLPSMGLGYSRRFSKGGWILGSHVTLLGEEMEVSLLGGVELIGSYVELQMHMEEPCFDFLRTKQTLG